MTELTQAERDELAVLAGGKELVTGYWQFPDGHNCHKLNFEPDSPDAPAWQLMAVIDAVRKAGRAIKITSYGGESWVVDLVNEDRLIRKKDKFLIMAVCRAALEVKDD